MNATDPTGLSVLPTVLFSDHGWCREEQKVSKVSYWPGKIGLVFLNFLPPLCFTWALIFTFGKCWVCALFRLSSTRRDYHHFLTPARTTRLDTQQAYNSTQCVPQARHTARLCKQYTVHNTRLDTQQVRTKSTQHAEQPGLTHSLLCCLTGNFRDSGRDAYLHEAKPCSVPQSLLSFPVKAYSICLVILWCSCWVFLSIPPRGIWKMSQRRTTRGLDRCSRAHRAQRSIAKTRLQLRGRGGGSLNRQAASLTKWRKKPCPLEEFAFHLLQPSNEPSMVSHPPCLFLILSFCPTESPTSPFFRFQFFFFSSSFFKKKSFFVVCDLVQSQACSQICMLWS